MDATRRRPWIDWIHTALVQGTQVRDYVKLDDQRPAWRDPRRSCGRCACADGAAGAGLTCVSTPTFKNRRWSGPCAVPDVTRFSARDAAPRRNPRAIDEQRTGWSRPAFN